MAFMDALVTSTLPRPCIQGRPSAAKRHLYLAGSLYVDSSNLCRCVCLSRHFSVAAKSTPQNTAHMGLPRMGGGGACDWKGSKLAPDADR